MLLLGCVDTYNVATVAAAGTAAKVDSLIASKHLPWRALLVSATSSADIFDGNVVAIASAASA